jgi:sulfonate transport system ATP-binding protein
LLSHDNAVELHQVRLVFGDRVVLDDLGLRIQAAEFVAILGASGTGKTTLLRLISGLDHADGGTVRVARRRSVVFQEPRLVLAKRVWQNVVLGRRGSAARAQASAALTEVGLAAQIDAWPKYLSGGEAQRVALARAMVREPDLLLLDEPFASLDALTRIRMQDLVAQLWHRHRPAVVLVTHDVDEAILLADRIIVLSQGRVTLDQRIHMPRPRSRTGQLLGKLGVLVH